MTDEELSYCSSKEQNREKETKNETKNQSTANTEIQNINMYNTDV